MVALHATCYTSPGEESYYYLSADRGQTWRVIPLPETVPQLSEIFFLDSRAGWRLSASGSAYQLERTTDGGATWQAMSERVDWQEGFQFVDANTGWVVSSDDLQRTTDGGKTWVKLAARFLPAAPDGSTLARLEMGHPLVFKSIQMIDSSNGWAAGADGYVFRTGDGGKTWQDVTPLHGYIFAQRELFALDARRAWTTVLSPSSEMIWSTIDGGQSWHQITALSELQALSPESIRFLDENIGWFQSSQLTDNDMREVRLMKTRDNGATWEIQSIGLYSYYARDRMGFMFLDEQNGFRIEPDKGRTLKEFLSDSPAFISKTADGGATWQPVDLPPMVIDADAISLDQEVWPGGVQDLMQDSFSCDEGITLHAFSLDIIGLRVTCETVRDDGRDSYFYFLLSEYYLSTDAGATWNNWMSWGDYESYGKNAKPIESEFFLPGGTGWRLKANQLLQTTDGGKTWITLKAVGWDQAQFDFINAQEGWGIVKSRHAISLVHTMDGGKTWEEIKPVVAP